MTLDEAVETLRAMRADALRAAAVAVRAGEVARAEREKARADGLRSAITILLGVSRG